MFRRAAAFGREAGRDAQVGIIEQLYELHREQEADAAQRALRAELDDHPYGPADLRVFDDMTEMLSDAGQDELALEWCEAGLDRAAAADADPAVRERRRSLLLARGDLRERLGIELDGEDLEAQADADESAAETIKLIDQQLDSLVRAGEFRVPRGETAFDGVVLRWDREDFPAVRSRWPEQTAHYGDDYDAYAARIQREAKAYVDAGAARVRLVTGGLADYEEYARRERRDPADQSTRQNYGQWCTTARPDRVRPWPPSRNDACWCDSGRKYKKCCGAPAQTR